MSVGRLFVKAGKLLSLIIVIGTLYAYAMFQGGFVSWFLFYSVVSIIICNMLFMLYPLRWIEVERRFDKKLLSYDEKMEVTLLLKKKFPFPSLYISVMDTVPSGLEGMGKTPGTIFFFTSAKQFSYSYDIRGGKRGEYWFSPITLKTGDLFGFFHKEHQVDIEDSLTVLPRLRLLKRWKTLWNDNQETTPVTAKLMEDTFSVAGVRDYVPGDKLTSIDWKVTARAGKLVTKEFESQSGKGYTVILDNTGKFELDKMFEERIEFAASLIDDCYKQAIPAGFGVSTGEALLVEEGAKLNHFQTIYRELARLERIDMDSDPFSFFKQPVRNRSIVYITSDVTAERMNELESLLKYRNELVIALFLYEDVTDRGLRDSILTLKKQGANIVFIQSDSSVFDVTS
ncbi:DUF58 domain-containing protein [Salibacterium salarium]|uniref:DUF58 domain-containing protein n=1 Tax=Salibacterium salarium TaxID=284579 RepID=A0A3R9P749_9BACI|nr:DUF58 domain-containing protein [Salibacterium salarium]RSL31722.1 DUF58 domain-containing protein [Salibacterium salarium]